MASKASGASIDYCGAHVWTLHDRKAWRIGVYLDRDDETPRSRRAAESATRKRVGKAFELGTGNRERGERNAAQTELANLWDGSVAGLPVVLREVLN